jgi:hypothetical protein
VPLAAATGSPRTTRFETPAPSKPPFAAVPDAVAATCAEMPSTVTSPPKRETEATSAEALATASPEVLADAFAVIEPTERAEPSAG